MFTIMMMLMLVPMLKRMKMMMMMMLTMVRWLPTENKFAELATGKENSGTEAVKVVP